MIESLELVMLIHVPQRTVGSRFEPGFRLDSYRWILGEFSTGVRAVSHLPTARLLAVVCNSSLFLTW